MFNDEGVKLDLLCFYGLGGSEKIVFEGYNVMYVLIVMMDMMLDELFLSEWFVW